MAARGRKPEAQVAEDKSATSAKPLEPGYVRVTSPMGSVTEVPEAVLDALLASGYTK